jgi:hypothetical protein
MERVPGADEVAVARQLEPAVRALRTASGTRCSRKSLKGSSPRPRSSARGTQGAAIASPRDRPRSRARRRARAAREELARSRPVQHDLLLEQRLLGCGDVEKHAALGPRGRSRGDSSRTTPSTAPLAQ